MSKRIKIFFENESGATAIEYGLIASLIGIKTLDAKLSGAFSKVSGNLA